MSQRCGIVGCVSVNFGDDIALESREELAVKVCLAKGKENGLVKSFLSDSMTAIDSCTVCYFPGVLSDHFLASL